MELTVLGRAGRAFIASVGGIALLMLAPQAVAQCSNTGTEAAVGVTTTSDAFELGDVRRYGAVANDSLDDTAAFTAAISTGQTVFVPSGTFDVDGGALVMRTVGQSFRGQSAGGSLVRRRSYGAILTIRARHVDVSDVAFFDSTMPPSMSDNIVVCDDADNVLLRDVNVYGTRASAVNAGRVDQFTIRGGLYDNQAAGADIPVINIGRPGQTDYTYYWVIDGITLQPSGHPLRVYSSGSGSVTNSQLGGLELKVGPEVGSVSNRIVGNRITGNIIDEGSNSTYTGNALGAHTVMFAPGSSGILWTGNVRSTGSSIVNNGLASNVVMEQDRIYSGYLNLAIAEGLRLGNNKSIRLFDSADSNYAHVTMSAANALTLSNNSGPVHIAANAGSRVQNIVGGVEVARFDGNSAPGQTRFLIYDVDKGTLQRVSVGPADSGGTGYKILRIPN